MMVWICAFSHLRVRGVSWTAEGRQVSSTLTRTLLLRVIAVVGAQSWQSAVHAALVQAVHLKAATPAHGIAHRQSQRLTGLTLQALRYLQLLVIIIPVHLTAPAEPREHFSDTKTQPFLFFCAYLLFLQNAECIVSVLHHVALSWDLLWDFGSVLDILHSAAWREKWQVISWTFCNYKWINKVRCAI